MSTKSELEASITSQGDYVRKLKTEKAVPDLVAKEVEKLKELKSKLALLNPKPVAPATASTGGHPKKGKSKASAFEIKCPKGTKDHHPHEMILRNRIFDTLKSIFELNGGVTIDTPVFELKEILTGKYGEDSKLIYDLQDQGGELCSLRYDLTVPFARFLAMNREYQNIKRYHIGKVYRRDNPAMTKGRLREFYQCDFDIAGVYERMVPDAEVLKITCKALEALQVGEFTVKINHRCILDGLFAVCGVPDSKFRSISSAVDKLDKSPWSVVRQEMVDEKGLEGSVADHIGEYVKLKGGEELIERLTQDQKLSSNKHVAEGLSDLAQLFKYLRTFKVVDKFSFDLSLARGLDYYTGVIYEVVVAGSAPPVLAPASLPPAPKNGTNAEEDLDESQIGYGSIAAGGRYDNLVGMFASGNTKIPCVGISFGVERIYSILSRQQSSAEVGRGKILDVFVMSVREGLLDERMSIASELQDAGISAEYLFKEKPKAGHQFEAIERDHVPVAVIVGPDEIKEGMVRIKEQKGKEGSDVEDKGDLVPRKEIVDHIRRILADRRKARTV